MKEILKDINTLPQDINGKIQSSISKYEKYANLARKAKIEKDKILVLEEERKLKLLGSIFKKLQATWIDYDVAFGMIKEQLERLQDRPEYIERWRALSPSQNANLKVVSKNETPANN